MSWTRRVVSAWLAITLAACTDPVVVSKPEATPTVDIVISDEEKAGVYLSGMTLREKIEQMIMPSIQTYGGKAFTEMSEAVEEILRTYHFGGIILFASNITADNAKTVALTQGLQNAVIAGGGPPLLIGADQEGGVVNRLSSGTTLPSAMALAASGDEANAALAASIIASDMKALGFNMDFAPDLDVNSDPANPVIGTRSYGDDPETVGVYGSAFASAMQEEGLIACGKHFPGHGDTDTDSHTGLPRIDKSREELEKEDLLPFRTAVENGIDMIMSAHVQYPQIETETYTSIKDGSQIYLPSTLSRTMITEILREELGFEGVITTDSLLMSAIKKNFSSLDAAKLAINAGVDILLMPFDISSGTTVIENYVSGIEAMVESGEISEDTINAAVKRILTLKYKRGIMAETYSPAKTEQMTSEADEALSAQDNRSANRLLSQAAATLVKNDDDLVPVALAEGSKVVLIAKNTAQANALTYGMNRLKSEGVIDESVNVSVINENYGYNTQACISALSSADLVVVTSMMTASSQIDFSKSVRISSSANIIARAVSGGAKVIAVSAGLPYDVALLTGADAIMCVYNYTGVSKTDADGAPEGTYSESLMGALDVIFGKCSANGHLPVNIYAVENGQFTSDILYERGLGILTG